MHYNTTLLYGMGIFIIGNVWVVFFKGLIGWEGIKQAQEESCLLSSSCCFHIGSRGTVCKNVTQQTRMTVMDTGDFYEEGKNMNC